MKAIASVALFGLLALDASAADTYTFTTSSKAGTSVSAMGPAGKPVFGGVSTFDNQMTDGAGKKSGLTGSCATWSAEPGAAMAVHGVCNSTSADGNSNVMFTCAPADAKSGVSNCWAFLMGTSGKYKGKAGTASWHSKANADGKGSTGAGAGVWND